jgi:hypothetical protein
MNKPSLLLGLLLVIFTLSLAIDTLGSLTLVNSLGPGVEKNPLMRGMVGDPNHTLLLVIKLGEVALVLSGCLWLYGKNRGLGMVTAGIATLIQTYLALRVLTVFLTIWVIAMNS